MTESNETIAKSGDPGQDVVVVAYMLIALGIIGLYLYFWFFWIPKMKENDGEHNDQELQVELSPTKQAWNFVSSLDRE